MYKNVSGLADFMENDEKYRGEILRSYEKSPLVAAFVLSLFDTPDVLVFDKARSASAFVAYRSVLNDMILLAAITVDRLLDGRGSRVELLRLAARLDETMRALDDAAGQCSEAKTWRFSPRTAAVLKEIDNTLRRREHA